MNPGDWFTERPNILDGIRLFRDLLLKHSYQRAVDLTLECFLIHHDMVGSMTWLKNCMDVIPDRTPDEKAAAKQMRTVLGCKKRWFWLAVRAGFSVGRDEDGLWIETDQRFYMTGEDVIAEFLSEEVGEWLPQAA